jgi:hypothetical protein
MDTFLVFVGWNRIKTISMTQWPILTFDSLYCGVSFITLRCNSPYIHVLVKMLFSAYRD